MCVCVCMHGGHQEGVYVVCIAPLNEIIRRRSRTYGLG